MRLGAGALCLGLLFSAVALAQSVEPGGGKVALAAHRGGRTFLFIAEVKSLEPGLRQRLLSAALPEPIPGEAADVDGHTVLSMVQPLGTPFATWAGRTFQGFQGERQVCVKPLGRLVLLGFVPGKDAPTQEAMTAAMQDAVLAGELDDRNGACREAQLFHDPELGSLAIATATSLEDATPEGRDELFGGIARLRLQPEWEAAQDAFRKAHAPAPRSPFAPAPPDAGTAQQSWDGSGPRAVRFGLGHSPYVAAASHSPGCDLSVAKLFHAMNQPIPFWPSLSFESPVGALPDWVADAGGDWPVLGLEGALWAPEGDRYRVRQRFPGTQNPACPHSR